MTQWLLENETAVRLGAFGALLTIMIAWELARPARSLRDGRGWRWFGNFALVALATLSLRVLVAMSAVAVALHASEQQHGLLNHVALPVGVSVALAMVALDLLVYIQHWTFHRVPLLWRLHRVHHADRDYDVSTALRFHPIEIMASLGIKLGAVYALGAPAASVILFEVLLNGAAMFNHGNVNLGPRLDSLLRYVMVTPAMHRIHHSARPSETNSNFGFNLPWWDHVFGTYRSSSVDGDAGITLGLPEYQERRQGLLAMLLLPF